MKVEEFLKQLDEKALVQAIAAAELRTSAELRLFFTRNRVKDAIADAEKVFLRLGMRKTEARNGALIFVAPLSGAFAIIGDENIHGKCGKAFWQTTAAAMEKHFREGEFQQGLLLGIRELGEVLSKHFPRATDDRNELPDEIGRD
jgi:uncharacterized membrane protein